MSKPKINTELLRESLIVGGWTLGAVEYIVNAVNKYELIVPQETAAS